MLSKFLASRIFSSLLVVLLTSIAITEAVDGEEGMSLVPAGEFIIGGPSKTASMELLKSLDTDKPCCEGLVAGFTDCQPAHRVYVDAFWIDTTEVTNAQYNEFVSATSYITVAERPLKPNDFPGVAPENLQAGSVVFTAPTKKTLLVDVTLWWAFVPGANWKHPTGPLSSIEGMGNFPVVHVAYEDAVAYASWANKRLPTEAEWERAARGGLDRKAYPWGNELLSEGKWLCNAFQGDFPFRDLASDGFAGLAPTAQYTANGYGLFDMSGNVWEWCSDLYRPDTYRDRVKLLNENPIRNPQGPEQSFDPDEPGAIKRVHRGGSFLCSEQYCARYLLGTRGKGEVNTGSSHVGFRCVKEVTNSKR